MNVGHWNRWMNMVVVAGAIFHGRDDSYASRVTSEWSLSWTTYSLLMHRDD